MEEHGCLFEIKKKSKEIMLAWFIVGEGQQWKHQISNLIHFKRRRPIVYSVCVLCYFNDRK